MKGYLGLKVQKKQEWRVGRGQAREAEVKSIWILDK